MTTKAQRRKIQDGSVLRQIIEAGLKHIREHDGEEGFRFDHDRALYIQMDIENWMNVKSKPAVEPLKGK